MPTPAEKLTQVEDALRRKFFPLVTKRAANWPEHQHDVDRLSRSLAAYAVCCVCDVEDSIGTEALVDGGNDGGIDAIYFDRAGSRLLVVQSKFKRPRDPSTPQGTAPDQGETLKFINGVKALMQRRFNVFNAAVQGRLDEVEEALDTPGVKICLVLVFLGEALDHHAAGDISAMLAESNRLGECMISEKVGLTRVYDRLVEEQASVPVDAHVTLENWAAITAPRKAVYGQISAASLAELVETHGKALFERNIRHYLGSIGVNVAIERTVRGRPGDLFYLNNGLTAVAESITPAGGTSDRCVFGLRNLSIVNGAQTAGAIATVAGSISPDAKLLITIIDVGAGAGDFGLEITRARNHQNVVRGVDFAALDPNQERLRQELALAGITYHYRPSAEARARREDAFTLEEAALALACLSFPVIHSRDTHTTSRRTHPNAVDLVVTAKKEIGRLWERDGAPYGQIFAPSLSGLKACRAVRIFRFIDHILAASERSETAYARRMFFRHGRYFVMALVAHRLMDLIRHPELALSEADRTTLSQKVNELAEMIFALSQPWLASRGYLSIFRNLTDAQPLANAVLDRLAEQDATARLAAPTPPTSTPSSSSGTN